MAKLLARFSFTNRADKAISRFGWYLPGRMVRFNNAMRHNLREYRKLKQEGAYIPLFLDLDSGYTANSLDGNDKIIGTSTVPANGSFYYGIEISGELTTGAGDDTISGTGRGPENGGILIEGTINTGSGNDKVTGYSNDEYGILSSLGRGLGTGAGNDTIKGSSVYGVGIFNRVTISTGSGKDHIIGISTYQIGIENKDGTIKTGKGNDKITGTGKEIGIFNSDTSSAPNEIDTGAGNDTIIGRSTSNGTAIHNDGTIYTGKGNDWIIGYGEILNFGLIDTGDGNDTIITIGAGLYQNGGTIKTGEGNDIVDTLSKGASKGRDSGLSGEIYLGDGNDTIKGFGGDIYGGTGTDTILLGPNPNRHAFNSMPYTIIGNTISGAYLPTMKIYEFEKIGGINGGLFNLRDGILSVDNDGVATFVA
jgi:hypothetical protein